jgi:hypothetical protein
MKNIVIFMGGLTLGVGAGSWTQAAERGSVSLGENCFGADSSSYGIRGVSGESPRAVVLPNDSDSPPVLYDLPPTSYESVVPAYVMPFYPEVRFHLSRFQCR